MQCWLQQSHKVKPDTEFKNSNLYQSTKTDIAHHILLCETNHTRKPVANLSDTYCSSLKKLHHPVPQTVVSVPARPASPRLRPALPCAISLFPIILRGRVPCPCQAIISRYVGKLYKDTREETNKIFVGNFKRNTTQKYPEVHMVNDSSFIFS